MSKRPYRISDVFLGIGYFALALALVAVALGVYNQSFTKTVDVTLNASDIGNALQKGSDVKLNGVPVGRVTKISATDSGARLALALNPDAAKTLPTDTEARLLPKTLFGERYVSLIRPGTPVGSGLVNGDTISQDTSQQAVELEDVFDKLLPVLKTIQPAKLAATLGELAAMLNGQGQNLGDTLVAWGKYLKKLNPLVPAMTDDLKHLAVVADTYNLAAPDLLNALGSMTVTSKTLVDRQAQLRTVYANVISSANTTGGWVGANQNTIEVLSAQSRRALEAVKPYATEFPCLFKAMSNFIPVMDKTLGAGTDEPGIHVRLNVVASRGKYVVGKDTPAYATSGKARCPYVTGQAAGVLHQPLAPRAEVGSAHSRSASSKASEESGTTPDSIPAPPSQQLQDQTTDADGGGLGDANSPAENELIAELVAPTVGLMPAQYPDWGSLLVGPVLRNAKVILQ